MIAEIMENGIDTELQAINRVAPEYKPSGVSWEKRLRQIGTLTKTQA